jgi:hypothetical protein
MRTKSKSNTFNQAISKDYAKALAQKLADAIQSEATKRAKQRFAEMMQTVQDDKLSADELSLYYDAFADLVREPEEARAWLLRETQHLVVDEPAADTNPSIEIEIVPTVSPPETLETGTNDGETSDD